MRNRQAFYALLAQVIHQVPEAFGIDAVQTGEGYSGQTVRAAKNNVAVQVFFFPRRSCVFVSGKGGELARLISGVGGFYCLNPR